MRYTKKIAIFYPCTYSEYRRGDLDTATEKLISSKPSDSYSFDLFFIFNKPSSDEYKPLLKFESRDEINSVKIYSLNLSDEEDIYIQSWKSRKDLPSPMPLHGLSSGPNLSFYRSLYYLLAHENNYDNFLLIESDVHFVQPLWFDKLLKYCDETPFTIAGSKYKGLNDWHNQLDYKDHLNGIALYKNSASLYMLLKESEEYLINEVSKGILFINFDIAIDEWRRSQDGKVFFKKNPPLLDTDFITNASDPFDGHLTLPEILHLHPNTSILHHKSSKDNKSFLYQSDASINEDDVQSAINSKINSLKAFDEEHNNLSDNLLVFFNTPQNAGSYIVSKIFLYLRAYRQKFNLKKLFGLNKESIFNLQVFKNSVPIFKIIGVDSRSVLDSFDFITHNRSIEYQIEFKDLSQEIVENLFCFSLVIDSNGFPIFDEILNSNFKSFKKDSLLVLRDPYERVRSRYSYKTVRPNFENYLKDCKYEDSWVIRSLLNLPLNIEISKTHYELVCKILEHIKVHSIKPKGDSLTSKSLEVFLNQSFKKCWGVNSSDMNSEWLLEDNVIDYKKNNNSLNIKFSEVKEEARRNFLIHTHFAKKLYKKFLNV